MEMSLNQLETTQISFCFSKKRVHGRIAGCDCVGACCFALFCFFVCVCVCVKGSVVYFMHFFYVFFFFLKNTEQSFCPLWSLSYDKLTRIQKHFNMNAAKMVQMGNSALLSWFYLFTFYHIGLCGLWFWHEYHLTEQDDFFVSVLFN